VKKPPRPGAEADENSVLAPRTRGGVKKTSQGGRRSGSREGQALYEHTLLRYDAALGKNFRQNMLE
jgi:hypothetical protein